MVSHGTRAAASGPVGGTTLLDSKFSEEILMVAGLLLSPLATCLAAYNP